MPLSHRRLLFLFASLAAWAIVVVFRLAAIQLARHDHYVARAQRQQESTLSLNPVRGSVLDSRNRVLAESVAAESIYADPQVIRDRKATAGALAAVNGIGLTAREIEAKLDGNNSFAWIARQLPMEVTAQVRKLSLPGVYFLEAHRRSYPRATLAANLIGYVGVDADGLSGIEHSFDDWVRGTPGKVTLLRDARRGAYLVGGDGANRPRDGNHVVLTLDSVIQFIAERALQKAVTQHRAKGGSVIVLDDEGSILAMASSPTFDPNRFREFPPESWRERNTQGYYEPGSTFKIVTAAAGLEERLVTPSQVIDCGNGAVTIANITIREHDGHRYDLLSFEDVIVQSSNVGSVRVGLALGQDRFHDWIRRFGFGERTGITLPGESPGLLRRAARWTQVSPASIAIGQEIGVTPLQVARAVAVVANGGMLVEPRLVRRVVDSEGNTVHEPPRRPPQRVISERTAAVLNEILKGVVARGTGGNAAMAEHVVAGKTGTAQKAVGRGGYVAGRYVGSFAGYVPADQPRLVILVVIDEPRGEHYGGIVAAPVFREVAEATLRYLGVAPSIPSRTIGIDAPRLAEFSQSVSSAGPATAIPDLRGLDARAAVARAVASGLNVRAVGTGVVSSQDPQPGGALRPDRRVTIYLSQKALPVSVAPARPEVRG